MRIGVTGHMNLTPRTVNLVRSAMREALGICQGDDIVGFSCLATGADSIFAQEIIDVGGTLTAVVPSADYRDKKVDPEDQLTYDLLLLQADHAAAMPHETAGREAYAAANEHILASVDHLFAVWDGQLPAAKGGTADAVAQAQAQGTPVTTIWPSGAQRRR